MPHLNSSINSLPLYSLPLITLLNFYTNSFIILLPYSTFFSSTTLIVSSSPLPNSCFKSVKNLPLLQIPIFYSPDSPLHSISISANSPYAYDPLYLLLYCHLLYFHPYIQHVCYQKFWHLACSPIKCLWFSHFYIWSCGESENHYFSSTISFPSY